MFFHCLNDRSAQVLRRNCEVRQLIIKPNTSTPRRAAEDALSSSRPEPWFVYCGRAAASKNLSALCQAWPVSGSSRTLRLYGPNELKNFQEPMSNICYCGRYTGKPPFRFGDIVFLPSFREGHPNVLVEAFKTGAIVVGSDIAGVREHLSDGRGVTIPRPLDIKSISEAIGMCVSLSSAERAAIGLRAIGYFNDHFSSKLSSAAASVAHVLKLDQMARNPNLQPK
ncbi:glycosyltransferase [Jatrophihabitans sp.]|uniref:glycosyltransferase n=1 Tax=Jatrophihabitans sp. TaxID=1932789 RepID=UPI0038CD146D